MLKAQLSKQKEGIKYTAPAYRLNHALFALNFLNVDKQGKSTPEWFWSPSEKQHPLVMWKDPLTGQWMGPDDVLMWGRGFLCIFPRDADSPHWIPER
jgi:hypothetical protein